MKLFSSLRAGVLVLVVALVVTRSVEVTAAVDDFPIATAPLFMGGSQPPLMMLVMSRDEQLFNKAYSDYTDLDDDGTLDTNYKDSFDYAGYFDPKLCYAYGSGQFKASGQATGHVCSGQWSGNFLNWITMSRLDVLRFVLYGGQRVAITGDTDAKTVLERADVPNDLHAWTKVYSGDISKFAPLSGTTTFCNATITSGGAPLMRYASGAWPEWAATASNQCGSGNSTDIPGSITDKIVRIEVCDPTTTDARRESFCKHYSDGSKDYSKPVGLLQDYGESGRLRFGLVSGSYSNPRSGGILRRSIGKFAGNGAAGGCAAGDEVDLATGKFCNQTDGTEGIVNTLSHFKLTEWNYSSVWNDCNTYSILNRQGFGSQNLNNPGTNGNSQKCSAWGNPLAEMYAEALRYIAGGTAATTSFVGGSDLAGLPVLSNWTGKDPYRNPAQGGNSYCATCSILVLSSGLASFDSDEIPTVPNLGSATTATNDLGNKQGITGNYFAGRITATPLNDSLNTHEDICKTFAVTQLGLVRGICPDSPSIEGSYLMAGLSYKAFTTDLRPGLQGKSDSHKNNVKTYTVALAENLPKFEIPVGTGSISLAPLCQANNTGTAKIADSGWRTCFLGSVGVGTKTGAKSPNYVYGRPLTATAGSFSLVWEDSLWGNDHDNDVVSMMTYCVGPTACAQDTNPKNTGSGWDICWKSDSPVCGANGRPTVGNGEVLVRIENLSAYAGNAMLTGFTVTGSDNDGVQRLALRPGDTDGSFLTNVGNAANCGGNNPSKECSWDKPKVLKFSAGNSNTKLLESPLWYAAKFGGFDDINNNGQPDEGEWDKEVPGTPDNYFLARDPSKLKDSIEKIFEDAAGANTPTGAGASGTRLNGDSFTLETTFNVPENSNDWTGNVVAHSVNADGSLGAQRWDAAAKLQGTSGSREIWTVTAPTKLQTDGSIQAAVVAKEFTLNNLLAISPGTVRPAFGLESVAPAWLHAEPDAKLVDYLKGDDSREQKSGGPFRNRTSIIGDIVNSTAEIVAPKDDYGYGYWGGDASAAWKAPLGASYKTYLATKLSSGVSTVYVGANDGMLHAFDASLTGGGERFAYIPSVSREKMGQLADPGYLHRYTMDGAITTSDVPSTATGGWRTLLVASMGDGGRSVSGLNVTNPGSFDETSVLWELRGTDPGHSGDNDLGYVLGKPMIVPMTGTSAAAGPRWVAVFGNGINSSNGDAVLYVVDVNTGAVLKRLSVPGAGGHNGLVGVAPVAVYNSAGLVDTVYGGDMKGNIWKFDLSGTATSSWNVAFDGNPLFTAKDAEGDTQPITGGIEVTRGPNGGTSILFGTGQYFAVGDNNVSANTQVQTLYSVQDRCAVAACAASNRITADRESSLTMQVISSAGASGTYDTRTVSQNGAGGRGWYVDLKVGPTGTGERFIGTPQLQNGKVFFTTYEPSGSDCAKGGTNWLYGLSLVSGAGAMSGVSTSPGGNSVCTGDCGALSLGDGAPARETNILLPPPPTGSLSCPESDPTCSDLSNLTEGLKQRQCTLVLRAPGADPLYLPRPCGRQSWRQVR